ncbi:multidrug effflux MFS transporter [Roseibium marinum]|uniref:Bcr/CflA family efflux transporter n=1 Tax=Roseibium marinum TaxID=281252 RepID=A0A2S3USP1_9HYPH|nr:multidrug effflux MFS transporter [Roseibium marinum]POF30590.1 DHA1 family bicyclomycin/chloramphenicol resistance-like MFS transporter [Roseibium marinum]
MTSESSIMSARRTSLLGAGLVAVGPISMALYTPAMPALVEAFGTTQAAVKLTVTAYFAGFAVTQLVCGPLTDAFGRKPVTQMFLALYLVSSVLASLAPTVELMVVARALQGIGAAVGIAVSRAIVRDQFTGQTSARVMNAIATMLAIGPAISPTIGGIVLELFGWREVFWCMVIYGVVLMAAVALFQVETNPQPGKRHLNPKQVAASYGTLLKDPRFLAPGLLVGLGLGNIYALATVLPFVLIYEVGLSPSEFGLTMIIQSGSFIVGTLLTGRLLRVVEARRLVPYGLVLWLISAGLMCYMSLTQPPSIATIMGPVGLFMFAITLVLPASFTESMAPFPHMAGAASSMLGFLQFGGGFLASLAIAGVGSPLLGMGIIPPAMLVIGIVSSLIFRNLIPRPTAAAE